MAANAVVFASLIATVNNLHCILPDQTHTAALFTRSTVHISNCTHDGKKLPLEIIKFLICYLLHILFLNCFMDIDKNKFEASPEKVFTFLVFSRIFSGLYFLWS